MFRSIFRQRSAILVVVLAAIFWVSPASAAKNVILMVADGAGWNVWLAAAMYEGRLGQQVFEKADWVKLGCSTYPLNLSTTPTGDQHQDERLVYDPLRAWAVKNAADLPEKKRLLSAYTYLKTTATDSAAAATAMATGKKTYNNAINWSNEDRPFRGETIAEIAKLRGKAVGVVTSVPWSHATPAALGGAHNRSRNNYAEIAEEMLAADWLDVIIGAGHPHYDDDGRPLPPDRPRNYQYVGGQAIWDALSSGRKAWKLVETKADFEALLSGPAPPKLLGTVEAATTLQQNRGRGRVALDARSESKEKSPAPFETPLNPSVPDLATLARAAINCLDDNPSGFYLMIEGGAIDWANHANQPERMIEEHVAFLRALEAVVRWIEAHGGWEETLLIVTADHECGLLWGPKSDVIPFDPIQNHGVGRLPGLRYNSNGHTNSLVPLFARGPGSRRFLELVRHKDEQAAKVWSFSGGYIDNTDIFHVMKAELQ